MTSGFTSRLVVRISVAASQLPKLKVWSVAALKYGAVTVLLRSPLRVRDGVQKAKTGVFVAMTGGTRITTALHVLQLVYNWSTPRPLSSPMEDNTLLSLSGPHTLLSSHPLSCLNTSYVLSVCGHYRCCLFLPIATTHPGSFACLVLALPPRLPRCRRAHHAA